MKLSIIKKVLFPSKRWLRLGLALVAIVVVATLGFSGFMGYSMTRVERVPVGLSPADFGLSYQEISFSSTEDGLLLSGWYLPAAGSQRVIIMLHGEEQHRADPSIGMLDIAQGLVEHGYSVLMFDFRGHGESEGSMVSGGVYEKRDLLGAVDYLKGRGLEDIGVLGFSLGAVTALMAAGETDDIDAIVADSSFADLNDIIGPEFSKRTSLPEFFAPILLFMVKVMYGVDFTAIRPVESVRELSMPILFIQGEEDEIVPLEHANRLKEASRNPESELWIVPRATHVRSYIMYPEDYMSKITVFFDQALG
jgi:fermentation-respiration switch protein FrsA (DUF1100 family)